MQCNECKNFMSVRMVSDTSKNVSIKRESLIAVIDCLKSSGLFNKASIKDGSPLIESCTQYDPIKAKK